MENRQEKGTHLRHCYQGEYKTTCKYGEQDCPAKPIAMENKTKTDECVTCILFRGKIKELRTEIKRLKESRLTENDVFDVLVTPLDGCYVEKVIREIAKEVISAQEEKGEK